MRAMEGIVCDADRRVIDEAPAAYKDLTQVRPCRFPAAPVGARRQTAARQAAALLAHRPCLCCCARQAPCRSWLVPAGEQMLPAACLWLAMHGVLCQCK